jgi:transposase
MYVLRTEVSWRNLPRCYGYWHSIYLRLKKGLDRAVWWKILMELKRLKRIKVNIVMSDSTTIKVA